MPVANAFTSCSPYIRTDIAHCGSTSLCTATVLDTADQLESIYMEDGKFRIMGAMFANAMELKACGIVQNSWRDFFMANLKPMKKNLKIDDFTDGLLKIKPFIMAKQKHPVNNVYWRASAGASSGDNWAMEIQSMSGIPADARSFPVGMRIYIKSKTAGGAMQIWHGVVVSAVVYGDHVNVVATPQNDGSTYEGIENPEHGIVTRGSANIGRTESYCDDQPGYLNDTHKPFWIERTQTTICSSDRYDEWYKAVKENNPLYKEFFELPEAELNRQKLDQFQNEIFENVMHGSPISGNQNLNDYQSLPQITNFLNLGSEGLGGLGIGLGVQGVAPGACDGYKANTIGWLEQLRQCNRVYDALGDNLDLWSLMDAIYLLSRTRQSIGSAAAVQFDVFTDSTMADIIEMGFIQLFKNRSADTLQMNFTIEQGTEKTFGFYYRRFKLVGKAGGIILNVMTATALDDYLAEWVDYSEEVGDATVANGGHALWLIDPTGMYIGVVDSDRDTRESGDIRDLVKNDPQWLCVRDAPKKRVTIVDATYAAVVDCPAANLLLWNVSGESATYIKAADRPDYMALTTVSYY